MATPTRLSFRGNPHLKRMGEKLTFTQEQMQEIAKCTNNPVYFLETYGRIVSQDDGIVPFILYPYQRRIIRALKDNRKILGKLFRQAGKSTIIAGYLAWFCLFNKNKTSAILANKGDIAKEIFSRVQFIIENTPKWLQQGIKEWNKTSFELENGAKCFCSTTSADAIRGMSIHTLIIDEAAHLPAGFADEFFASVFPTISASKTSRIVMISTPKGMNYFAKMWHDANAGLNGFVTVEAKWQEHPHRDQKWADEQLAILGETKFNQEVLCEFVGSSNTLISGRKISELVRLQPMSRLLPNTDTLLQYFPPHSNHSYIITVDVSRGADLDYSTFTVIDISSMPYQVVCVYRDNKISTQVYPEIIYNVARMYNMAFVLIEINDLGQQVADTLFYDLEYENVYMSTKDAIKEGGDSRSTPGVRTTVSTKARGCDALKGLVENDKLMVNDSEIISELSTFNRHGKTYKADNGKHDDLAMCLVMFGFLTTQPVFKELFDFSLREKFFERQIREVEEQMLPIGYLDRGDAPLSTSDSWLDVGFEENTTEFWAAFHG